MPDRTGANEPDMSSTGQPDLHAGGGSQRRGQIELNILSDPANLAAARTAVERLAADAGFDADAVGEIGLVLNEALANIIRHAYHGQADRPIRIVASSADETVTIAVRDWGTGENPAAKVKHLKPDPLKPGGLGLVCMHEMMDQTVFSPQPDGMLLTMRRSRVRRP